MSEKQVNIKIKRGKVAVEFSGFKGKACEVLGQKIMPPQFEETEKELKDEYYEMEVQTEKNTQWS